MVQAVMPLATIMDPSLAFKPEFDLSTFFLMTPVLQKDEATGRVKGLMLIIRTSEDEVTRHPLTGDMHTQLDKILADSPVEFTYAWLEDRTDPATINNQGLEEEMRKVLGQEVGEENLLLLSRPFPIISEDLAYICAIFPAFFIGWVSQIRQKALLGYPIPQNLT